MSSDHSFHVLWGGFLPSALDSNGIYLCFNNQLLKGEDCYFIDINHHDRFRLPQGWRWDAAGLTVYQGDCLIIEIICDILEPWMFYRPQARQGQWLFLGLCDSVDAVVLAHGVEARVLTYLDPLQTGMITLGSRLSQSVPTDDLDDIEYTLRRCSLIVKSQLSSAPIGSRVMLCQLADSYHHLITCILLRMAFPKAYFEIDDLPESAVPERWRRFFQNIGFLFGKAPRLVGEPYRLSIESENLKLPESAMTALADQLSRGLPVVPEKLLSHLLMK